METTKYVLLALMMTGCASSPTSRNYPQYWLWTRATGEQRISINTPSERDPSGRKVLTCAGWQQASLDWTDVVSRQALTISTTPAGKEFWIFEARERHYGPYCIRLGRIPVDHVVTGDRTQCEAVRSQWDPDISTEPCQGPFYFTVEPK